MPRPAPETLAPPNPHGSVIEVEATATDGEATSAPVRSEPVTTTNSGPPTPAAPVLSADRDWLPSELSCAVEEPVLDPDGDPVTYELEWLVDGVGQGADVPEDRTLRAGSDLTSAGGLWSCRARALDDQGGASDWVLSEDESDQTCDPQTVSVTGAWSASLAYNNGYSWNDELLRAYTYGSSGGNDDIVGWVAFDVSAVTALARGVDAATLDLYCLSSTSNPELVVVQTGAQVWSPTAPDPETLTRDGEISDHQTGCTTGERARFPLDIEAWTEGPGPEVEGLSVGVDNLKAGYSYAYFAAVEAGENQPELELVVCQ